MTIVIFIPVLLYAIILLFSLFLNDKNSIGAFIQKKALFLSLILVAANGLLYVFLSPYWSPVDEQAHFAFIETISAQKKIPLLTDYVSNDVVSLMEKTHGGNAKLTSQQVGLAGTQYEALQPPLYYLVSIPFYQLGGSGLVDRIYALRLWGLLQLLIIVFLSYKIFTNVKFLFPAKSAFFALSAICVIGMTPAMVTRAVTVGNNIFPIIFLALAVWWASRFLESKKSIGKGDAVILGLLTGLAVLSRFLMIVLIPLGLLLFLVKREKILTNSLIYVAIILFLLTPWLIFNESHYGSLTANNQARKIQAPALNTMSGLSHYGLAYVRDNFRQMLGQIWIPEEAFSRAFRAGQMLKGLARLMNVIWLGSLFFAGLSVIYLKSKRKIANKHYLTILSAAIFIIVNFLFLVAATLYGDWPILLGRYMHAVLIMIAFFFSLAVYQISQLKTRFVALPMALVLAYIPLLVNLAYLIQLRNV